MQSSALLILAVKREIECDGVIFADTGSEKPTTYEFLDELKRIAASEGNIPYQEVSYGMTLPDGPHGPPLHEYCLERGIIPSTIRRWCTDRFKIRPMKKVLKDADVVMVGFSADEAHRIKKYNLPYVREFPLISLGMTQQDCVRVILDYGLPQPTKSSCFCCPFQAPDAWKWLKNHYLEGFDICLAMEEAYYKRRPEKRNEIGLYRGLPLWKAMGNGFQFELLMDQNFGCLSGQCFH